MNQSITLSASAANFNMAVVQGCQSTVTTPATSGEQFHIATPPANSGVWQTGIFVR